MKKLIAGLMIAAGVAWGANEDFAFRLPAEIQTAGPVSLEELTWQQGSTPLIRVDVLQRGKAVMADTNTTVRMIIAPTGTGTYYAVSTNYLTTNTSYYVQWPTIGTNSLDPNGVQSAWFYTIYFERDSKRYWTGNGELYIEHTTSTDPDGLVWQEILTGVYSVFGRDGIVTARAADYAEFYLQPGAAGTSTNLSDYNNDAGFITTVTAAPVGSVFGRTGAVVAVSSDYAAFYAATGSVATVAADLAAHELETTGAHGGIVASTDSRLTDARVPLAHTQGWHTITGTPDSVAGYGITNLIIYEGDSRLTDARTPLPHDQGWSTITSTPDTVAGYGITDVWTRVESDGRYGSTADVAQVATDLSDHESATGTAVHGLGTMSTQGTGSYYTTTAADLLLAAKAGTATVAAIDGRLTDVEAWPTGTWSQGASDAATWTSSVAHEIDSTATTAWWKASSDGASATAGVAAVEADIAVLETQKLDVATFDGFTNSLGSMAFEDAGDYATTGTVGAIDDRLSIVETGKLDVITAASTYATTGTVGAIDDRVSIVETGKVDYIDAEYTDTVARAAMVDSTATAAWWKASADGVTATAGVAAAEARLDVVETGKVDYVNSNYTETVAKADSALQPGADGTSTNLGDYNNDAGFITDAGVESLNTVTGAVTLQDGTNTSVRVDGQNIYVDNTYAAPVDSVFGETGAIVAAWPHYSAFYSLLRFNGTNYAGTNVFTGGGVTRTADGFEFSAAGIGTITNITGTDSSVVVTGGAGPETDLSVTNYVMGLGFLTNEPEWEAVSNTITEQAGHGETAYGWGDHAGAGYLTNEALWQASSGDVMQVVGDFGAVSNAATTGSNLAYIASTNAEAARVTAHAAYEARMPAGAITMWAATNAPTGWLVCDGSSIATNDYPALHSAIGYNYGGSGANFNVPNLHKKFAKGGTNLLAATGGASTVTLSSNQLPAHLHSVNPPSTTSGTNSASHLHTVDPPSTSTSSDGAHSHKMYRQAADAAAGTARNYPYQSTDAGYSYGVTETQAAHSHSVDIASFNSGYATGHTHATDIAAFNSEESGGGTAHENEPPYVVVNYIIKY